MCTDGHRRRNLVSEGACVGRRGIRGAALNREFRGLGPPHQTHVTLLPRRLEELSADGVQEKYNE